jgi:glucose-1-phosphate adenylyltransferase
MEVAPELLERHGVEASRPYIASMGIYLFRKEFLAKCLDSAGDDFGGDIIPAAVGTVRIQAHFFKGYWRDIGTIQAFYDTHMDLVKSDPPFRFDDVNWPIYTRPRYLPPARLDGCRFVRSVLAEGGELVDCEIEDSIVGLTSLVQGASIRRSLLMGIDADPADTQSRTEQARIGPGTVIERAIIDKNARIGSNVQILETGREQNADGTGWAIRDGVVVVRRNAVIPDGTVVK